MSQLKRVQDARQDQVERDLAALGIALALLEHDRLRVDQAISRTGQIDLLNPVTLDMHRIMQIIQRVQERYREMWDFGQERKWGT